MTENNDPNLLVLLNNFKSAKDTSDTYVNKTNECELKLNDAALNIAETKPNLVRMLELVEYLTLPNHMTRFLDILEEEYQIPKCIDLRSINYKHEVLNFTFVTSDFTENDIEEFIRCVVAAANGDDFIVRHSLIELDIYNFIRFASEKYATTSNKMVKLILQDLMKFWGKGSYLDKNNQAIASIKESLDILSRSNVRYRPVGLKNLAQRASWLTKYN